MGETPASFATSRIVGILCPISNMDLPEGYDIDTIISRFLCLSRRNITFFLQIKKLGIIRGNNQSEHAGQRGQRVRHLRRTQEEIFDIQARIKLHLENIAFHFSADPHIWAVPSGGAGSTRAHPVRETWPARQMVMEILLKRGFPEPKIEKLINNRKPDGLRLVYNSGASPRCVNAQVLKSIRTCTLPRSRFIRIVGSPMLIAPRGWRGDSFF